MILQKLIKTVMTLSLLAGATAQANHGQPERFPGPGRGGDHRPPGPVRPDPDGNECRERTRGGRYYDPRCDDSRNDQGRHRPPRRQPPRDYPPYNPPYTPPYNPPPVYNPPPSRGTSSIDFHAVTRRSGGEWLRVNIHRPIRVDYIQVQVLYAALQIHEAAVITRSGARYNVRELSRTGVFYSSQISEYLSIYEDIIAIDLRAESMGGHANVRVTLTGENSTPLSGNRF